MLAEIKKYFKKIPKEIYYTLLIFFITRLALTIIGATAIAFVPKRASFIENKALNAWGLWDTGWYLNIAKLGYSAKKDNLGQANYGFFPLYPLFIKIFSFIFQNYFFSALIVSNLFLILAAIFLYKLTRLDCDEKTSLRTVKYLFIFPGSFILSAAMSESLFLFLILACFYYAKKQKWFLSGVSGMLLTLTKAFGIAIVFPIIYEYIKAKKINKENNFFKTTVNIFSILLIPAGLAIFAIYTYFLTGDLFAYPHMKQSGWGNYLENPIKILYTSLTSGTAGYIWGAIAAIMVILLLIFFYKKIGFSYFLAGILIALFGILYGGLMPSIFRYYTAIFPVYIILGKVAEDQEIDNALMIFLLLLQGFLMAFWTIQSGLVV